MSARSAIDALSERLRGLAPGGASIERQLSVMMPVIEAADAVARASRELDGIERDAPGMPGVAHAQARLAARARALNRALKGFANGR